MPATQFDRSSWAKAYAKEHLKTDPGIDTVYYLPANADEREIRFVEINHLIGARGDDALEPIEFGIDAGTENAHTLFILDVTPEQWERIETLQLPLPAGWSLDDKMKFSA